MPRLTEQQINNIYLRCNSVPLDQLLELCLDPESGVTVEGLRAVKFAKIDLLEKQYNAQAEDIIWAKSQNSVDALTAFIEKCKQGVFTTAHLSQANEKLRELAIAAEEDDWQQAKNSNDIHVLNNFIKKCTDKIYSDVPLRHAKDAVEFLEWQTAKDSQNSAILNGYIQKCKLGIYSNAHVAEANDLLEKWENGTIQEDWDALLAVKDSTERKNRLNEFAQKYANNFSATAQKFLAEAAKLNKRWEDEELARRDWIDAKDRNTILDYVNYIKVHPYSEYREEAEQKVKDMKGNLLTDMKRFPFKYTRDIMYAYISSNALTMEDLVDNSDVLTDRGYSHIKKYPRLLDEQRQLPVSKLENPYSEDGNTDIYFFGGPGSGKTCVLSGLMSLTGQLGFRFDPKGPGGGGNYAMELRNYARKSMLPPRTDQQYIQVIDGQINDEDGNIHKIAFIEMSGEKTAEFAAMDNQESFDDLGPGAASLLSNDNNKVLYFVIDPTNEKNIEMGLGSQQWVMQSDVLNCVSALLSRNPTLMKKVIAIHVILTKSDTLGEYVDQNVIEELLNSQGYQAVLADIKTICEKYDINKQTGFHVGLYPFCAGKFMPGEVYTFDETDSLKILRVIQKNTVTERKNGGFFDSLAHWFNS